jgi:hypothetical protein
LNVNKEADAEFMHELEKQDSKRYYNLVRNIQRHNPNDISESQAITNFMLGLPTARFRFAVVAGAPVLPAAVISDPNAVKRRNLRKRQKQAKVMRSRVEKTVSVAT